MRKGGWRYLDTGQVLIESACSVDRVEEALSTLLPMLPEIQYFRFNPGITCVLECKDGRIFFCILTNLLEPIFSDFLFFFNVKLVSFPCLMGQVSLHRSYCGGRTLILSKCSLCLALQLMNVVIWNLMRQIQQTG